MNGKERNAETMDAKKPETIYYFAATHWDREWYKTVDKFRFMLVPVMDGILFTLENNPDFALFTLDGQTCVLADYLAVRPENKERLARLIADKRLLIGPWFTMPDEFLVSSESLIQNLLTGHRIAASYGTRCMKTGYVCDSFGHIANFPQLLNGFNIHTALISRGLNDSEVECFFRWESPDGSAVTTFKAPETCGYGSFYHEALSPFGAECEAHLEEITELAAAYTQKELSRSHLPVVLLMDGMDHAPIHGFMPEVLKRLSEQFSCPVKQISLEELLEQTGKNSLPVLRGELVSHGKNYVMHNKLIPHTLSSRYDLKQANDACQRLLERFCMPAAAITLLLGGDPITGFLRHAYHYLLQNHAHDSICGCSIDAVHREMLTRFAKVRDTAQEYFKQFCARRSIRRRTDDGDCIVEIFNPLPYAYHGLLEFDIDFPQDFETQNLQYMKYEQRNTFLLYDEEGNEVKYNLLRARRGRMVPDLGGNTRLADPHRVALISSLRPMGFTSFSIKPLAEPYRITERLAGSALSCSNGRIDFSVQPDGTITIKDLETGAVFPGLHSFIDCCEAGDGWYHTRPIEDQVYYSSGCNVSVSKTFDGYAACKYLVTYTFLLPREKCTQQGFTSRSRELAPLIIRSEFTVSRGSKLVRVRTEVENNIKDHRLQLHLPTNLTSDCYHVNQCNLILSRRTGLDTSHTRWKENDITEYSFEDMAYILDGESMQDGDCGNDGDFLQGRECTKTGDCIPPKRHGLLFLSGGGLHEISCPADTENSMDITLMRCFGRTTGTNGETDGQLPSTSVFEYALMPISNETEGELVKIRDTFTAGYHAFTIPHGKLLPGESAFTMQSLHCAYITSLPAENGGILLRVANYSQEEDTCSFAFFMPVQEACLCNFLEEREAEVTVSENKVSFLVGAYRMATLHVQFAAPAPSAPLT